MRESECVRVCVCVCVRACVCASAVVCIECERAHKFKFVDDSFGKKGQMQNSSGLSSR